ncbi:MAG: glycosyltransferase family 2 protein, partial [Gimesia sp.]|nr:glycosyltransferase family 2 protein [Gimesia sp.]
MIAVLMDSVACIIVTFNPDFAGLVRLLDSVTSQVSHVIVVDNSTCKDIQQKIREVIPQKGTCITKGFNSGIAEAINTGIHEADKLQFSHVILFDQDSVPDSNLIDDLSNAMQNEMKSGRNIAAAGPKYQDVKGQSRSPFVKLSGLYLHRIECSEEEVVSVDHLISSGSLISMKALHDIGFMEEKLFIDYVDTEWCLRAKSKGYEIIGVGYAQMQHDLGDEFVELLGRTIPVHSSLRYYYLIRNGLWLIKQNWVSRTWKLMDFRRLFLVYIVYSLFVGSRFKNWKMLSLGIWHAMIGR